MFTTPGVMLVTTPEVFTVAIEVFPLYHEPPEGEPLRVMVDPVHITDAPVIDAAAFTVTV